MDRRIVLEFQTGQFKGLRQIQGSLLSLPETPVEIAGVQVGSKTFDFTLVKNSPRYAHYSEIVRGESL